MNDNENRLWSVLNKRDPYTIAYVYELDRRGQSTGSYRAKYYAPPSPPELYTDMQSDLGPGWYRIIVRAGRKMLFSGRMGIGPLRSYRG